MDASHIIQISRLCQALLELVARDDIGPWFERPNPAFGGLKPLEVIERGQVDRIWNMIYELRAGAHV
jgi:hypothetical protein